MKKAMKVLTFAVVTAAIGFSLFAAKPEANMAKKDACNDCAIIIPNF